MFACVFSFADNSFSVLGRNSKKLVLEGDFKVREKVTTKWDKKEFKSVIVKIGGKYFSFVQIELRYKMN